MECFGQLPICLWFLLLTIRLIRSLNPVVVADQCIVIKHYQGINPNNPVQVLQQYGVESQEAERQKVCSIQHLLQVCQPFQADSSLELIIFKTIQLSTTKDLIYFISRRHSAIDLFYFIK